jgi:hypothetical protein
VWGQDICRIALATFILAATVGMKWLPPIIVKFLTFPT